MVVKIFSKLLISGPFCETSGNADDVHEGKTPRNQRERSGREQKSRTNLGNGAVGQGVSRVCMYLVMHVNNAVDLLFLHAGSSSRTEQVRNYFLN